MLAGCGWYVGGGGTMFRSDPCVTTCDKCVIRLPYHLCRTSLSIAIASNTPCACSFDTGFLFFLDCIFLIFCRLQAHIIHQTAGMLRRAAVVSRQRHANLISKASSHLPAHRIPSVSRQISFLPWRNRPAAEGLPVYFAKPVVPPKPGSFRRRIK